jgi:ubiquinone/menaquinone biosynthesis C-methylase UbiE
MNDFRRYDAVAETYERVRAPITATVAADLVALAEPGAGASVLDVGAGTGAAMAAAQTLSPAARVTGIDNSVPMLARGRRARPGLRVAAAEAIQLPFRDAAFDVVLANFVLAEFTRFDTALFDLIRVLRPGGRLAASAWVNEEDELGRTWRLLVEEAIGPEMAASARQQAIPWAERFGDADRLSGTLRDAGLHPIRVERRSYRFSMAADDYVAEQATRAVGRFVREMLGEAGNDEFLARARARYRSEFGDEIRDGREALIAIGTKPPR